MSDEQMRSAFEEWWKTKFAALMATNIPKDYWQFWEGEYWCSWQAAWQAAEKARAK